MSRELKVKLVEERNLNKDFQPVENSEVSIYLENEEATVWIGHARDYEEVIALIHPDNIVENLRNTLSEKEYSIIGSLVEDGEKYSFFDEVFSVKVERFENISEEDFEECFEGLRGAIPNKNNSSYEEMKVNLIVSYVDCTEEELECDIEFVKKEIKELDNNDIIVSITHDTDIDLLGEEVIVFFDVIIDKKVKKEELRELLLEIEKNI